ncbi:MULTISPECIES: hypothetical protein [unclassified Pseudomonas]|uniref:hypothetical protein n=1 Tax=unclassified Pseudomonas TaxID=196821 RepID=UPI000B003D61|nr:MULTISPECIES: hypothetical protein [unclassified Pseudomonas]
MQVDLPNIQPLKAAQAQLNKGCNKLAEPEVRVDAKQQTQEATMENHQAVKALGGLFR